MWLKSSQTHSEAISKDNEKLERLTSRTVLEILATLVCMNGLNLRIMQGIWLVS